MNDVPSSSAADERVEQVRARQQQELQRFLLGYALIEGALLAVAVVVIYLLELIDPDMGLWILIGIVLLGGGVLSTYMVARATRNRQEVEQARRLG